MKDFKITLKQLNVFAAIARHTQANLAADELGITQSAISKILAQLEANLHAKLFQRNGKRLILNELGELLLPHAIEILDRTSEFENLASQTEVSGELKIGASKTIGSYVLPKLISEFIELYPNVKIDYVIENSASVIKDVLNCNLSIGFIGDACHDETLNVAKFKTDKLRIFVRPEHPLLSQGKLGIDDILKYPWVARESGSGARSFFAQASDELYSKRKILLELNEPEAIKRIIQSSDAIACLSENVLADDLNNGKLVALNVKDVDLKRTFYMISLKDRFPTKLLSTFMDFVLNK